MINISEVKRYLNIKQDGRQDELIESECLSLQAKITPRMLEGRFGIQKTSEGYLVKGTDITLKGKLIEKTLKDCESIVLFVLTLTTVSDNMLREYSAMNMSKAVILNACMTAYIEAFADDYQNKLKEQLAKDKKDITPRISCGYGDFAMSYQPKIISLLQADKYLGVHCNASNMLTPVKSITALIGIKESKHSNKTKTSCSLCESNCSYRKMER